MFWFLIYFFYFFYNVYIVGIQVYVVIYNKVYVKEGKIFCKLYIIIFYVLMIIDLFVILCYIFIFLVDCNKFYIKIVWSRYKQE